MARLSTILDQIDSGSMLLPEFQRGYVWNKDQIRGLMRSLYKGFPVGALLVFDEVITGFGRTGPLFASEDEGIVPDLMTVAKGLTSGYCPMGAVFLSDKVYETIADGAGASAIGHGYTYSAHPVSAAVGLACLDLYENGLLENGRKAGQRLMAGLHALCDHPLVGEGRGRVHQNTRSRFTMTEIRAPWST